MFGCPVCKSSLERTPTRIGIVWVCSQCGGRAVTMSLLRKNVRRAFVNSLWQKVRGSGESLQLPPRPCPSCSRPMRQVSDRGVAGPLALDACLNCQFIWFDLGETAGLPGKPRPPAQAQSSKRRAEPPPRAREALALDEIRRIRERSGRPFHNAGPPDDWWRTLAGVIGLPVEERSARLTRMPILTWLISLAVLIASLLAFQNLDQTVAAYGLLPCDPLRLGGLTLLTSFFLHGGIPHLLGNLYFLLLFGDNVEDLLGHLAFLLLLALATVAGGLLHILGDPQASSPHIGASGGISGVIVFYVLAFPHARLRVCGRVLLSFHWFRIPAAWALVAWIGLQTLGAWQQLAGISAVSSLAHLGGAATGFLAWLVWKLRPNAVGR